MGSGRLDVRWWNLAPIVLAAACAADDAAADLGDPCTFSADCGQDSYCFAGVCTPREPPGSPGCIDCSADDDSGDDPGDVPTEPACVREGCGTASVCAQRDHGLGVLGCVAVDEVPECDLAPLLLPLDPTLPAGAPIVSLAFLDTPSGPRLAVARDAELSLVQVRADGTLSAAPTLVPESMAVTAVGDLNADAVPDLLLYGLVPEPQLAIVVSTAAGPYAVAPPRAYPLRCDRQVIVPSGGGGGAGIACMGDADDIGVTPMLADGALDIRQTVAHPAGRAYDMVAADLDGDGTADLVVANANEVRTTSPWTVDETTVLLDRDFGIRQLVALSTADSARDRVAAVTPMADWTLVEIIAGGVVRRHAVPVVTDVAGGGDIDGDGNDDLVLRTANGLVVLPAAADPDGAPTPPVSCHATLPLPFRATHWAFGDLDGDGQHELTTSQGGVLARFGIAW